MGKIASAFALTCVTFLISSCGGGGGGGSTSGPNPSSSITSYFVDGPTKGLSYSCSPSGKSGVTGSNGDFTCASGDTTAFSLSVGASSITLGSATVPNISGISIPVTMLNNGLQIAEILQALNHGSSSNIDVSGLTILSNIVAEISTYISTGGTLPAGQNSDDQFLAYIQSQVTASPPVTFVSPVSGTGTSFQQNTVLPALQATIVAIAATNPPPVINNNTTKLSGSLLVSGNGTVYGTGGCTNSTLTVTGGGILNATVSGNLQTPGIYPVTFSTPGFSITIITSSSTCPDGQGGTITIPGSTGTSNVSPFTNTGDITVSAAVSGTNLSIPTNYTPQGGCSGGTNVTGTNIGLSNPLVTMSVSVSCSDSTGTLNLTETAKMVGAW